VAVADVPAAAGRRAGVCSLAAVRGRPPIRAADLPHRSAQPCRGQQAGPGQQQPATGQARIGLNGTARALRRFVYSGSAHDARRPRSHAVGWQSVALSRSQPAIISSRPAGAHRHHRTT